MSTLVAMVKMKKNVPKINAKVTFAAARGFNFCEGGGRDMVPNSLYQCRLLLLSR
jgi:hypothetical protein